jgi:Ca-activated chloride channel family protein
MSDLITLTCSWGREPLPISTAPQVNYLHIEAHPAALPRAMVPINFCLVLDRSGSMKGNKLESMKAATHRVVEQLTPHDVVSLVVFDDTVQVVVPATSATDKAALFAQIETIEEMGGTAMSLGLAAGQAELQKQTAATRLSHMLLLTDGQTWGDEDDCRAIARSLSTDGVKMTALGLGTEWNEKLLDDLADLTGGTSDYIADPSQLDNFFQRTIRDLQGTVARDLHLLLRLVSDVTPRAVFRVTPTIANLGYKPIGKNEVTVQMSDLATDRPASIVIDLLIPPRSAGAFRIAQAELHATLVGQEPRDVIKQDIVLDFATEASSAVYNPVVMNLVEKVTAFKLQTRALEEAEVGNISGATQKLRAVATRLLDLGELDLAAKAQQQADQLEQGTNLSAEAQKELRYATRRLTQKLDM